MNDYEQQAVNFLHKAKADMAIYLVGKSRNKNWDEKELRNLYDVTITTPRGTMTLEFWDSIHNTEIYYMIDAEYGEKMSGRGWCQMTLDERRAFRWEFQDKQSKVIPTFYDVLACLTKSDPGTFKDFCWEYGYSDDSISALKIYTAVQNEWADLCRIFTPEQLEELAEIQ